MLDFNVSIFPLLTVAIVNFILSWVFYSPVAPWFKAWQIGVGADPNKTEMTEEDKKAMPRLMGGAVVATFLFSYGLQVFVHSLHAKDFIGGAVIGFVAWFAFAATHSLNTQFEGRKPVVLLINNFLYIITYVVFGGIIAIWK
jgi:UDP-N-acetylmuramyl pentapeptide phosphotransferase/UDP-N-acetylglucosamine-1-phosphate transferase